MKQDLWAITSLNARHLPELLPDDVFPVSLKIGCDFSPKRDPLTYRERLEDGSMVKHEFDENTHSFPVYESKKTIWIPRRRVYFMNPLIVPSSTKEKKRKGGRVGPTGYSKDPRTTFPEFIKDLNSAIEAIELSEQPRAAKRIYLSEFVLCTVPEEYVNTNPDGESLFPGGQTIDLDMYENEEECWFVSFNKASTAEAVIQITGGAKESDGLVEGMVPGKTTIPCIQTSLMRVFALPLKGRKVNISKYYYTDALARKHGKEEKRPEEFRMEEGYDLDRRFRENFESLVELSEEEPPLIKRVTLEGETLEREKFRVSDVEEKFKVSGVK